MANHFIGGAPSLSIDGKQVPCNDVCISKSIEVTTFMDQHQRNQLVQFARQAFSQVISGGHPALENYRLKAQPPEPPQPKGVELDPVQAYWLAKEGCGFQDEEIKDARATEYEYTPHSSSWPHVVLEVDLVDSDWEPTYTFYPSEIQALWNETTGREPELPPFWQQQASAMAPRRTAADTMSFTDGVALMASRQLRGASRPRALQPSWHRPRIYGLTSSNCSTCVESDGSTHTFSWIE
jgi:hypothetical protein